MTDVASREVEQRSGAAEVAYGRRRSPMVVGLEQRSSDVGLEQRSPMVATSESGRREYLIADTGLGLESFLFSFQRRVYNGNAVRYGNFRRGKHAKTEPYRKCSHMVHYSQESAWFIVIQNRFYANGRHVLSAGQDRAFCLFSVIQDQQTRELYQRHITKGAKNSNRRELSRSNTVALFLASIYFDLDFFTFHVIKIVGFI
ncbi:hypothetical protein LXL04_021299 [Taraxacum kok-saghyz]